MITSGYILTDVKTDNSLNFGYSHVTVLSAVTAFVNAVMKLRVP